MKALQKFILRAAPYWLQDLAISAYNVRLYARRHGGRYSEFRRYYAQWDCKGEGELQEECSRRLRQFLAHAKARSRWYSTVAGEALADFPVLEKADLVGHLREIATVPERGAKVSLTGGTTGASMKVLYTMHDMQERFAILDHFRERFGYKLGKRTAWFSGKSIASQADVAKGRCYRDDLINKIRFFSTFHINAKNFESYWSALEDFEPEFMVGFPSSVFDICSLARQRGLSLKRPIKVFFPTAETVLPMHRDVIGEVTGARLADQYASSEGAPFILECPEGRLHIHPLTGIFEVVDDSGAPARSGEMLVTSFTTHGTPLIRYRIGDRLTLADPSASCICGSTFPLVERIDGRTNDYVLSEAGERVNLGNLSNSTKDVEGIVCFQIEQRERGRLLVKVVANAAFDAAQEERFVDALRERVGAGMAIDLRRVDSIAREKSGKFRLVKNFLQ